MPNDHQKSECNACFLNSLTSKRQDFKALAKLPD